MKIIKGDLILEKDTTFDDSIEVKGNIKGCYNLEVNGNIIARNIDVLNISARNIDAWDINARNINSSDIDASNIVACDISAENIRVWHISVWYINAKSVNALSINALDVNVSSIDVLNINARNIDSCYIICEKRIKKSENSKTIAKVFVENRSKLKRKEW